MFTRTHVMLHMTRGDLSRALDDGAEPEFFSKKFGDDEGDHGLRPQSKVIRAESSKQTERTVPGQDMGERARDRRALAHAQLGACAAPAGA